MAVRAEVLPVPGTPATMKSLREEAFAEQARRERLMIASCRRCRFSVKTRHENSASEQHSLF